MDQDSPFPAPIMSSSTIDTADGTMSTAIITIKMGILKSLHLTTLIANMRNQTILIMMTSFRGSLGVPRTTKNRMRT